MHSLYLKLKDTLAAENVCLSSIIQNKNNPYPYRYLGEIYEAKRQYSKAENYYIQCLMLDSIASENWFRLGNFYLNRQNLERLDYCLSRMINCDSSDLSSWIASFRTYYNLGKTQKAKKNAIQAAQYLCKNSAKMITAKDWAIISELFFNIKELDSALKYIDLSIEMDSGNIDLFYQKSLIATDKKNFLKADSALNFALKIDPKNQDILLQKGNLYFNYLEKDTLAMELFKSVIDIDSTNPEANWYIGRIFYWNSFQ
jgi:tetratricopeptide (TPR) repeat protein